MHYPNLPTLLTEAKSTLRKGPIALVLVEDNTEVVSTVKHHVKLGFTQVIMFCSPEFTLSEDLPSNAHRVDFDVTADGALQSILNGIMKAAPGQWVYYCYNAEYLFFPFCETRSIGEVTGFMSEERRNSIMSYTVDLYAHDLGAHPDGVDLQNAFFDRTGYYALARQDKDGEALDRQLDIFGGLRWRFQEHIALPRQRLDRVSLIRSVTGVTMDKDRNLSDPEMNTVSCPWHNNLTAATLSFRTAKALCRNPGSKDQIGSFYWENSERFNWHSQQLLDLGLIEPGQWF